MTIALIDGDLIAYRCAASAEKDEEGIALIRASRLLQDIVSITDANEIKLFLSGSANFRKEIYPEYKANRAKLTRPRHLETVREFLVVKWGAEVTDGYEADDAIGMSMGEGTVCVSLDKDLKQLEGQHYNFVTGEFESISSADANRNYYSQLVLGDRADNVPGYDGKMRAKWPKFLTKTRDGLQSVQSARQMYELVRDLYGGDEATLTRNARLLYVWRKLNDEWQPPTKAEPTLEVKQGVAAKSASTPMKAAGITRSTGRGGTKLKKDGCQRRGQSKASRSAKKRRASSTSISKA